MSGPDAPHFAAAAFHLLPALVWGIMAYSYWGWLRRAPRPRSQLFYILPVLTSLGALHYTLHAVIELTPTEFGGAAPGLHAVLLATITLSMVLSMPLLRHLVPLVAIREERPTRGWLVVHYGIAVVIGLIAVSFGFWAHGVAGIYSTVMLVLTVLAVRRLARRGNWPRRYSLVHGVVPAAAIGGLAVVGVAAGLGLSEALLAPVLVAPGREPVGMSVLSHTVFGLAFAGPFVVTMLGRTLRRLLVAVAMIAATGLVYFTVPPFTARLANAEVRALVQVGAVVALLVLLVPGRAWLEAAIRRVMFRHSRRCREQLQLFLHTLGPDLGTLECCRRALAEIVRIMELRGAAILLGGDGSAVACGAFALAPIERVWPRGAAAAALPERPFEFYSILAAPLRAALSAENVALVVPIASPRARWGHLLVSEGVLSHVTQEEEHVETLEAFADQLALVLDGAELLARAVAVERSLAHAEKLAAIGELAARIAHEIRNPATAARSLAQQLCRESAAELAEPARLILAELERIERQVGVLLRFARREEYHFEPVDLGALARITVAEFRPRLEAAGVAVEVESPDGIVAPADREKIRQVLVNLIENAIDALADGPATRRLAVAVGAANGTAMLRVSDTGPGAPPDALPHLFEPFFSLKAKGTGLGLAIAKRTVEAHGGRIAAVQPSSGGLGLDIELPLSRTGGP